MGEREQGSVEGGAGAEAQALKEVIPRDLFGRR